MRARFACLQNGSTTDLWLAAAVPTGSSTGLSLWTSVDAGADWTQVLSDAAFPAGLFAGSAYAMGLSLRADNRMYVYGQSFASGTTTVYEGSHGLDANNDWTSVSTVAAVPGAGAGGSISPSRTMGSSRRRSTSGSPSRIQQRPPPRMCTGFPGFAGGGGSVAGRVVRRVNAAAVYPARGARRPSRLTPPTGISGTRLRTWRWLVGGSRWI